MAWLSDLRAYFHGVVRVLGTGGRYVLMEFHPTAWILGPDWTWRFPYSSGGASLVEPGGVSDYVQAFGHGLLAAAPGARLDPTPFENPHPSHEFIWGVGDILGAALEAGLRLERFVEYPLANGWRGFEGMTPLPGNRWAPPPTARACPSCSGRSSAGRLSRRRIHRDFVITGYSVADSVISVSASLRGAHDGPSAWHARC